MLYAINMIKCSVIKMHMNKNLKRNVFYVMQHGSRIYKRQKKVKFCCNTPPLTTHVIFLLYFRLLSSSTPEIIYSVCFLSHPPNSHQNIIFLYNNLFCGSTSLVRPSARPSHHLCRLFSVVSTSWLSSEGIGFFLSFLQIS